MKICWFGLYDEEYSRNSILISGLRENDVKVIECNALAKGLGKYRVLVKKLLSKKNQYDVIYCAFPINFNVLIAWLFSSKPIVIDAFFPLYEAYVVDRGIIKKFSVRSLLFLLLDKINLYLADLVIVDTAAHKFFWQKINQSAKIEVVPVGANTKEFFPVPTQRPKTATEFLVTFHGSYIPLQGISKIVDAAEILKDHPGIRFRFIGSGQLYVETVKTISDKKLNIELLPWLSIADLNSALNQSDVILGIFGDSDKTDRVIPNKLFQGIALKKAVITKDTPAIRECFTEQELVLVDNTPQAIADAILVLAESDQKTRQLANNAYNLFIQNFTEAVIGKKLKEHILAHVHI